MSNLVYFYNGGNLKKANVVATKTTPFGLKKLTISPVEEPTKEIEIFESLTWNFDPSETPSLYSRENSWKVRYDGLQTPVSSGLIDLIHKLELGALNLNPPYQRDIVWTKEQKQAYIKAIFESRVTATVLHCVYENPDYDAIEKAKANNETCDLPTRPILEVLDGKQRLTTLISFFNNEFDVQLGSNASVFFRDLSMKDKGFFENFPTNYYRIEKFSMGSSNPKDRNLSLNEKIELFLMINELGTRMSDADLAKAKALMN